MWPAELPDHIDTCQTRGNCDLLWSDIPNYQPVNCPFRRRNNLLKIMDRYTENKEEYPELPMRSSNPEKYPHTTQARLDQISKRFTEPYFPCEKGNTINTAMAVSRMLKQSRYAEVNYQRTSEEDFLTRPSEAFKRRRREKALAEISNVMYNIEQLSKIDVFPKSDEENRLKMEENLGELEMVSKLRAIFNVNPKLLATQFEYLDIYDTLTQVYHEPFEIKDPSKEFDWNVRIIPCSKKNATELSVIRSEFECAPEQTIYVLVSGDDITIFVKTQNHIYAIELDVSSMDISVRGHITDEFLVGLRCLGEPEFAENLSEFFNKAAVSLRIEDLSSGTKFQHYFKHRFQTFSGELTTTFKNTNIVCDLALTCVHNGIAKKQFWSGATAKNHFVKFFKGCGFLLEGEVFTDDKFNCVSFLRSWWIPTDDGFHFTRLPSAIATLGKTRKNWIHNTPGNDVNRSARYCMYAQAQSNQYIPRVLPILGKYLSMCDRVGVSMPLSEKLKALIARDGAEITSRVFDEKIEEHTAIRLDSYFNMLYLRYDVVEDDVSSFAEFCDSITYESFSPFTVKSGFGFITKIVTRDYGPMA